MPDIFISYSAADEEIAKPIYGVLKGFNLNPFMAAVSIDPGEHWTPQILDALRDCDWVFLLATKNAFDSATVQHEVGGAIYGKKKLVPIFWDMELKNAPVWVSQYQGIVIKNATHEELSKQISMIAQKIRADKTTGILVGVALLAAMTYLLVKSN